jgi:hypothetical protein
MKSLVLLTLIVSASISANAQSNLPSWFVKSFKQVKQDQKYELKNFLSPAYLQADFNGDGKADIAALTIEKKTGKKGILIIHGSNNQYFVLGAGTNFGNGSNDFKWAGGWKTYRKRFAYETIFNKDDDIQGSRKIKLKRPAIFIYDLEDGEPNSGGIIYWDGKKYIWIQQGE